jgi:hypothetical protein
MSRKVFEHEFKDTGIKVKLRKVNPLAMFEAKATRMRNGRPKPPTRTITDEGPLQGTEEVMDTDPTYIQSLIDFERKVDEQMLELQIKLSVVEVMDSDWQKEAKEYRQTLEEFGASEGLPESDLALYISRLACGTAEDLQEFINAINVRSQPSAEGVQASVDTFRDNVQE